MYMYILVEISNVDVFTISKNKENFELINLYTYNHANKIEKLTKMLVDKIYSLIGLFQIVLSTVSRFNLRIYSNK
jgi:hypothetical protein